MRRLLAIGVFAAAVAFAQPPTGGSIAVTGTILDQISITNASGTAVSATVTMANLTAANSGALVGGTADVRIRSNKAFTLTAATTFTNTGNGTDAGGSPITADDIGFGINASVAGGNGNNVVARTDTISPVFDYLTTNVNALTPVNGLTPYASGIAHKGTLTDIPPAGATVMTGNRISKKGNIQTDNNFLNVTFGVGTLPQYFTTTSGFAATITLTVATT